MKTRGPLLIVLMAGICLPLAAQRRGEPVEVTVEDLQATPVGISITLRSSNTSDSLHMMIGFIEGESIARAMHHMKPERMNTHDLFKAFLERNGWRVQRALIRDVKDGTFLADLTFEKDHETQVFDARPSDAMAIAIRFGAKIYVDPKVFQDQKQDQKKDQQDEDEKSRPDTLKL